MIHIGISGSIASGKTTLAKSLRQIAIESGYACEIIPFAYGVREVAALETDSISRRADLTNLFYSWGYDYGISITAALLVDKYMVEYPTQDGIKNRRLLQAIGTEVGRDTIDQDIWIHRVQQILRRHAALDFVISDDLRFDNEALAVDTHVAITIDWDDEGQRQIYYKRTEQLGRDYTHNDHASERSLTLSPFFTIPIGFSQQDVLTLFEQLNRVRKLRI